MTASGLSAHPIIRTSIVVPRLALDGARWVAARSDFLVCTSSCWRVCSAARCGNACECARPAGQLNFFNRLAGPADKKTFKGFLAPLRRIKWVDATRRSPGPTKQVLRRYTHRVAISKRRLVAAEPAGIAFRYKLRTIASASGLRLHPHEFNRRVLLHLLPKCFHRIYGLSASTNRAQSIAMARALLDVVPPPADPQ